MEHANTMPEPRCKIAIFGAGLIGLYIGGMLAGPAQITFIGRDRMLQPLRDGFRLSDATGLDRRVAAADFRCTSDPAALADAELILVATKCMQTADAAAAIAEYARPDASIISFQNGVSNREILAARAGSREVLSGMVVFNVVQQAPAHLHSGVGGTLAVARSLVATRHAPLFERAGLPLTLADDMPALQWGKLLLNLNNALNALSGVGLGEQLRQRDYRRCWGAAIAEGLELLDAAGIAPADTLPVPIRLLPEILAASTALYAYVFALSGGGEARVDPTARSSMANDLARGRPTEIDYLQGELVRLADRLGRAAPVSRCVMQLVKRAEAEPDSFPIAAADLWRSIAQARG